MVVSLFLVSEVGAGHGSGVVLRDKTTESNSFWPRGRLV